MAKIKWMTTPKAAYEWVEVSGGDTMSEAERKAFLDEYIEEHGLVPVEHMLVGETPVHKYGRYKAVSVASALPAALPGRENDLVKANAELAAANAELARLREQLGKQPEKSKAEVVHGDDGDIRMTSSGGAQTTEDARDALNAQADDDEKLVGSGEEVRADPSSNDKSADNPVVKPKGK